MSFRTFLHHHLGVDSPGCNRTLAEAREMLRLAEPGVYGYVDENRHMVECFRKGLTPIETFHDGVAVMEILMALYRSAELGELVKLPCPELEDYIPPVARTE